MNWERPTQRTLDDPQFGQVCHQHRICSLRVSPFFTSPWRGEVDPRSGSGGGEYDIVACNGGPCRSPQPTHPAARPPPPGEGEFAFGDQRLLGSCPVVSAPDNKKSWRHRAAPVFAVQFFALAWRLI